MSVENPVCLQANPEIGDKGVIHLYRPGTEGPYPFVIGIHGGGWQRGDQKSYEFLWPKLKPLGLALALVSYRTAPEFRFPAAYDDLLGALSWLKESGERRRLDVSRCLLYGASSGGHLVMLLATRAISERRPMPRICGVAQCCGIMDLSVQYQFDKERGKRMTEDFLGAAPLENPLIYREASPSCHIHSDLPPIWMAHGTGDDVVPISQSKDMMERLRAANHNPVYLEALGLPHTLCETSVEGKPLEPFTLLFEQDLLRFFQRTLKS